MATLNQKLEFLLRQLGIADATLNIIKTSNEDANLQPDRVHKQVR